jgi:hypothetical protein
MRYSPVITPLIAMLVLAQCALALPVEGSHAPSSTSISSSSQDDNTKLAGREVPGSSGSGLGFDWKSALSAAVKAGSGSGHGHDGTPAMEEDANHHRASSSGLGASSPLKFLQSFLGGKKTESGHSPSGHSPSGHSPSGHSPSGHSPSNHDNFGDMPTSHQSASHTGNAPVAYRSANGYNPRYISKPWAIYGTL